MTHAAEPLIFAAVMAFQAGLVIGAWTVVAVQRYIKSLGESNGK